MKWGGWEEALTIDTEATSMGQFSHMPVHCSPARTSRSSCLMWGWKYTAGAAACLWWAWVRVSWCLCTNRNCVTAGLCVLTSHLPHPQHWSRNLCCALYEVTVSTVTRWSFSPAVTSSACPCTRACTHYTDTQAHQRGLGQITCREVPIVHDSWPHLPTVAIIPGTFGVISKSTNPVWLVWDFVFLFLFFYFYLKQIWVLVFKNCWFVLI